MGGPPGRPRRQPRPRVLRQQVIQTHHPRWVSTAHLIGQARLQRRRARLRLHGPHVGQQATLRSFVSAQVQLPRTANQQVDCPADASDHRNVGLSQFLVLETARLIFRDRVSPVPRAARIWQNPGPVTEATVQKPQGTGGCALAQRGGWDSRAACRQAPRRKTENHPCALPPRACWCGVRLVRPA